MLSPNIVRGDDFLAKAPFGGKDEKSRLETYLSKVL